MTNQAKAVFHRAHAARVKALADPLPVGKMKAGFLQIAAGYEAVAVAAEIAAKNKKTRAII